MEDSKDMDIDDHIDTLLGEGARIVIAGGELTPNAPVPTCPGWTVRDLMHHLGSIHRLTVDALVNSRSTFPSERELVDIVGPLPQDDDLVAWIRSGLHQLINSFKDAPTNVECVQLFPGTTALDFWVRRQAHETTIHRVDVESARGDEISHVNRSFAADGIDELLCGFHSRTDSGVRSSIPSSIQIRATDPEANGESWFVHLSDTQPPLVTRSALRPADCTVSGPLELLYLALWNRLPFTDLEVDGNRTLLQLWRRTSPITCRSLIGYDCPTI